MSDLTLSLSVCVGQLGKDAGQFVSVTFREVAFLIPSINCEGKNAAVTLACILQQANHISSTGGYLRPLTRKATEGEL